MNTDGLTWKVATPPGGTGLTVRQVGQVTVNGTSEIAPLSPAPEA